MKFKLVSSILPIPGVAFVLCSSALAVTGEVSFTPTGFKLPVMKITLAKNAGSAGTALSVTNEQTLYKCSGATEADCLVDLSSQTDLDKIAAAAAGVTVSAGTYDIVSLYVCAAGKSGTETVSAWLKGAFSISSTNYSTSASAPSGVVTTGAAPEFTEITSWGCNTKSVILPSPVTVGSSAMTLTVLVDNTFLANSRDLISNGAGCRGAGGRGVCANIPALLPYVGTSTVTTKRFKLSHHASSSGSIVDAKANAIVIVPFAGSVPLTVFAGQYYSETAAPWNSNGNTPTDPVYGGPSYNTATDISSFKVNADGTLTFAQGASEDVYAGKFTTFSTSSHSSTLTTRNGNTWYYKATEF